VSKGEVQMVQRFSMLTFRGIETGEEEGVPK
jgi:hypothetical protein